MVNGHDGKNILDVGHLEATMSSALNFCSVKLAFEPYFAVAISCLNGRSLKARVGVVLGLGEGKCDDAISFMELLVPPSRGRNPRLRSSATDCEELASCAPSARMIQKRRLVLPHFSNGSKTSGGTRPATFKLITGSADRSATNLLADRASDRCRH